MSSKHSTEVRVGLVTVTAIVLFIVGITLGRGWNVSAANIELKFRFPTSGGIQPTAPVVVNGVARGSVTSIINSNGGVLITAKIDDISDLKKDLTATIMMMEITGGKKIEIFPGKSSDAFNPATEIAGKSAGDIGEMLAAGSVITQDVQVLIKRIDTLAFAATGLLGDGVVVNQLRRTVASMDNITRKIEVIVNANTADIVASIKNIKSLTTTLKNAVDRNEPHIDTLITQLNTALGKTNKLLGKADKTIDLSDDLLSDLRLVLKDVKTGNGLVSRLLYDKNFANKLDSTLTSTKKLLDFIRVYGINTNVRLGTAP